MICLFSVNQNSSPCEQAIVVHNNPVQARPTPLKGVPNSCNVYLNRRLLFFLFKNIAYWSNLLPIEFVRFSLFHSWEKYYQSKEGENIGGLPFWAYQAMQYPWRRHTEWHKREDPCPATLQDQAQERRRAQLTPSFGYLWETCGPQDEDPHGRGKGKHHDQQNHRLSWLLRCRSFDFAFLVLWVCPQLVCGRRNAYP